MDDVYGVVDTGETLLAEFYGARQGKGEDVTASGCRLEDLLDRAMEHRCVAGKDVNEMLRSRFWNGLCQKLKDGSRHKFDTLTDFDRLRKDIRGIEKEHQLADQLDLSQGLKKAHAKMTTVAEDGDSTQVGAFQKLETAVSQLAKQMEAMQQQVAGNQPIGNVQNMAQQGGGWHGGRGPDGPRPGNGAGQFGGGGHGIQPQVDLPMPLPGNIQQVPVQSPRPSQDVRVSQGCFKCGEFGHYKQDCPRRFEPTCWKCQRLGHRINNCPELNCQNPPLGGGR